MHPIELKLGRMILDISPHHLAEPDFELKRCRMIWDIGPHNPSASFFSIYPSGRCGGAPLEILNRLTAYSIHSIDRILDRMILDIMSSIIASP